MERKYKAILAAAGIATLAGLYPFKCSDKDGDLTSAGRTQSSVYGISGLDNKINSPSILQKNGSTCDSKADLEYLSSISQDKFVKCASTLPSDKLLEILTCDQYKGVLNNDNLMAILLERYDPNTKWDLILTSPSELVVLESLLFDYGETEFLNRFTLDFLNKVKSNLEGIDYLSEGYFEQCCIVPISARTDDERLNFSILSFGIIRDYTQSSVNKLLVGRNEAALNGLVDYLYCCTGAITKDQQEYTKTILKSEDIKRIYDRVMTPDSSIDEMSSMVALLVQGELVLGEGVAWSMREEISNLVDGKIEGMFSSDPIKLMRYRLEDEINYNNWNTSDFGLRKRRAFDFDVHVFIMNRDKNPNIPGAISTLDSYFTPYSLDKWNAPEFQKVLGLAQRNKATQFIEAAERYRP